MADFDVTVMQQMVYRCPPAPNFIQRSDGMSIDVADIDDATLRKIVDGWAARLIQHAKERRALRAAVVEQSRQLMNAHPGAPQ